MNEKDGRVYKLSSLVVKYAQGDERPRLCGSLAADNGAFYQFQSSVASVWAAGAIPFRLGLVAGSERRAAGKPPEGASGAWSLTGPESAMSLKKSPPVDETPLGKPALLGDVS